MQKPIYKPFQVYSGNINDLVESQSDASDLIEKGKALPVGTHRMWGGQEYVKHPDGWVHVSSGKLTSGKKMEHVHNHPNAKDHEGHAKKHLESKKQAGGSSSAEKKEEPKKEAPKKEESSKPKVEAKPSKTEHGRDLYEGHKKISAVKVLPFGSIQEATAFHNKLKDEVNGHDNFTSWDKVPETTMKLNQLSTTQDSVKTPDGRKSDGPILVVKKDGKHIIINGNHRAEQAAADGKSEIKVKVFDLDSKGKEDAFNSYMQKMGKLFQEEFSQVKDDKSAMAFVKNKLGIYAAHKAQIERGDGRSTLYIKMGQYRAHDHGGGENGDEWLDSEKIKEDFERGSASHEGALKRIQKDLKEMGLDGRAEFDLDDKGGFNIVLDLKTPGSKAEAKKPEAAKPSSGPKPRQPDESFSESDVEKYPASTQYDTQDGSSMKVSKKNGKFYCEVNNKYDMYKENWTDMERFLKNSGARVIGFNSEND